MVENIFGNDGEIPETLAKRKPKLNIDPLLAEGLKFSDRDLMANRANELTEKQAQTLSQQRAKISREYMSYFLTFALIFSFSGILSTSDGDETGPALVVIGLAILPLAGLFTISVLPLRLDITRDIEAGIVHTQTGKIILDARKKGKNKENYFLIINGKEFRLSREGFLRFKHLEHYTIYYTPYAKIIISAEPAE